jgi:putative copper export protein
MTRWVLLLHLLGAAVWTGGHLVLALGYVPEALRTRKIEALQAFEGRFERVGIPALLTQVATGLWLASSLVPGRARWFDPADPLGRVVGAKLLLLAATAALAADARLRLIPGLKPEQVGALAWHILPVTILSVLFVFVGLSARFGGL